MKNIIGMMVAIAMLATAVLVVEVAPGVALMLVIIGGPMVLCLTDDIWKDAWKWMNT